MQQQCDTRLQSVPIDKHLIPQTNIDYPSEDIIQNYEQKEEEVHMDDTKGGNGQADNGDIDTLIVEQDRAVKELPILNEILNQPPQQEEGPRKYQRTCHPNWKIDNNAFIQDWDKEGHFALIFQENT